MIMTASVATGGIDQTAMISVVIPHYNSSEVLRETVESILDAAGAERIPVEIVVADDGSTEHHRPALLSLRDIGVNVVFGERNSGRSTAVNLGAANAKTELLLILDCDCRPGSDRFFSSHLWAVADADVSLGDLLKVGNSFWGKYQDLAVERRFRQFKAGMPFSFTTANVLIRRKSFLSVGGYDSSYARYGFEDRDLLLRLQEHGAKFAYSPDSAVLHCDNGISLTSVARKMREAAMYTARTFRERHPTAYRSLGYAHLDANLHPVLRPFGRMAGSLAQRLAPRIDPWLDRAPFPLGLGVARAIGALAYLGGTVEEYRQGQGREIGG